MITEEYIDKQKNFIIVYAGDDNYAMQIGVSLLSLYVNNSDLIAPVYIISDGISIDNCKKLKSTAEQYGKELHIIEMPSLKELGNYELSIYGDWTTATYCRLFFPVIFGDDVERILWLDGDTLILGSIEEMLYMDMMGCSCAAVLDGSAIFKRMNGFKKEECYYNAGIVLIDLSKWKKIGVYDSIITEIKYRKGGSIDPDQSYLNCLLKGDFCTLHPRYNVMHRFYEAAEDYDKYLKKSFYHVEEIYSHAEMNEAVKKPVICHFTNYQDSRPWLYECSHPASDEWRKYLRMSQWKAYTVKHQTLKNKRLIEMRHKFMQIIYRFDITRKLWVRVRYGYWQ